MDGQGEQVFMNTLQKITSYNITDDGKTLNFMSGDIAMMRFTKKQKLFFNSIKIYFL